MMKQVKKIVENNRSFIFLGLLILIYFFLDYQTILFLRPQGIHFIRQTDSLSFVANYYKNGFHFFHPQVFNLQSHDGRAACEFPILYYLTAILYLVFNEHEFILRLITIFIVSTGFFYLFKLLYLLLHDVTYAIGFSFLFLSSTVLLYYTNNYLPDASALGFTLTGWYFFHSYLKKKSKKYPIFICFLLFTLASLIKVTFFINPVAAILVLVAFELSGKTGMINSLKRNLLPFILVVSSFAFVLGWNLYAIHYNKVNHDTYFLLRSNPIWSMSRDQIAVVWDYISHYWYSRYYYQSTIHVLLVIILAGLVFIKKSDRIILFTSLLLVPGGICYFLLFYAQFKDHDYYFIALIPVIIFVTINSFIAIRKKFPGLINAIFVKLLLLTLCILSLSYARSKLIQRYQDTNDRFASIGNKLSTTRPFLDASGIPGDAKFIIVADQTPNGGLYFINRPGWSLKDTSDISKAALRNYIGEGADYILFTGKEDLVKNFDGIQAGEHNGILIYKIRQGHF